MSEGIDCYCGSEHDRHGQLVGPSERVLWLPRQGYAASNTWKSLLRYGVGGGR